MEVSCSQCIDAYDAYIDGEYMVEFHRELGKVEDILESRDVHDILQRIMDLIDSEYPLACCDNLESWIRCYKISELDTFFNFILTECNSVLISDFKKTYDADCVPQYLHVSMKFIDFFGTDIMSESVWVPSQIHDNYMKSWHSLNILMRHINALLYVAYSPVLKVFEDSYLPSSVLEGALKEKVDGVQVLSSLKFKDTLACPICQEDFSQEDDFSIFEGCDHSFCSRCVLKAFYFDGKETKTCSMCRTPVRQWTTSGHVAIQRKKFELLLACR